MSRDPSQLSLHLDDPAANLHDLRHHVRRLDDKLGAHIQSCREFVDMCKEEALAHTQRHAVHELNFEQNMQAIAALTTSIGELTKATAGVVEAWTVVNAVQRFVKWASAFAFVGGLFVWLLTNTHFTIKSIP